MKNVGPREGGSITAAQFIQRFVEDGTKWAHIDMAGKAWADKPSTTYDKGATGFGVRLLDQYVAEVLEALIGRREHASRFLPAWRDLGSSRSSARSPTSCSRHGERLLIVAEDEPFLARLDRHAVGPGRDQLPAPRHRRRSR